MRIKLLNSFFKSIVSVPSQWRKAKRMSELRRVAFSNPTTEEGFAAQREALKELNRLERMD